MEELIKKRKKYFEALEEINKKIEERAGQYFNQRVIDLAKETEDYKFEIRKEYEDEINVINSKIKLLDEMISEEMPEAKSIEDLMKQEPITEEVKEEIKEEVIEEAPVIEEIKEEPIVEETVEEAKEELVEPIAEEIIEPTTIEVKEEDIVTIEEVNEIPEEATVVEAVEIIPEVKEEVNNNVELPSTEEPIVIEPKHIESRPGMPEILNPR